MNKHVLAEFKGGSGKNEVNKKKRICKTHVVTVLGQFNSLPPLNSANTCLFIGSYLFTKFSGNHLWLKIANKMLNIFEILSSVRSVAQRLYIPHSKIYEVNFPYNSFWKENGVDFFLLFVTSFLQGMSSCSSYGLICTS